MVGVPAVALQALGRSQAELLKLAFKLGNTAVLAAAAVVAFLKQFTSHECHFVLVEFKSIYNVLVGLVHGILPFRARTIRFALVENKALDDAHFLGLLAQVHNPLIRIGIVVLSPVLDIAFCRIEISLVLVLVESLDSHGTDCHRDNTHGDTRQRIDHSAAEVVRRGEVLGRVEHRGNRRIPFTRLNGLRGLTATLARIGIMGSEHQEILGISRLVLGRHDIAITGHVTLSVSDVDVEIGIRGRIDVLNGNAQHA